MHKLCAFVLQLVCHAASGVGCCMLMDCTLRGTPEQQLSGGRVPMCQLPAAAGGSSNAGVIAGAAVGGAVAAGEEARWLRYGLLLLLHLLSQCLFFLICILLADNPIPPLTLDCAPPFEPWLQRHWWGGWCGGGGGGGSSRGCLLPCLPVSRPLLPRCARSAPAAVLNAPC